MTNDHHDAVGGMLDVAPRRRHLNGSSGAARLADRAVTRLAHGRLRPSPA